MRRLPEPCTLVNLPVSERPAETQAQLVELLAAGNSLASLFRAQRHKPMATVLLDVKIRVGRITLVVSEVPDVGDNVPWAELYR